MSKSLRLHVLKILELSPFPVCDSVTYYDCTTIQVMNIRLGAEGNLTL